MASFLTAVPGLACLFQQRLSFKYLGGVSIQRGWTRECQNLSLGSKWNGQITAVTNFCLQHTMEVSLLSWTGGWGEGRDVTFPDFLWSFWSQLSPAMLTFRFMFLNVSLAFEKNMKILVWGLGSDESSQPRL
jgi:hypothetical protein